MFEIINNYLQAWLKKDIAIFMEVLDENVRIEECYGPYYIGKTECQKWFRNWNAPTENKVISWEIKDYWEVEETAFATWTFECSYKSEHILFDGISLVKFADGKITCLKEFEMKHEKFRPYEKNTA